MLDFQYYNPTKIIFGKGAIKNLENELFKYGPNILLVYGSGSIKRTGIYEAILAELSKSQKNIYEIFGVQSNPKLSLVYDGINICKSNNIHLILAVGGGSAIDTAKAIAIGAKTPVDIWDFFLRKHPITDALPIATVPTLAGSGSESTWGAVITNDKTMEKLYIQSPHICPKFSILDPEYTFTVPREKTVNSCVVIMCHVFEQYFNKTANTPLQERFCEAIMKTVIENTYKVLDAPDDYDVRANLMWCSTMALNDIIGLGMQSDWATHEIEHGFSAVYDVSHGSTLSILFPSWMKYVMNENLEIFKQYALRVWDVDAKGKSDEEIALEGIEKTKLFFKEIGAHTSLNEIGIENINFQEIADKTLKFGPIGHFKILGREDILNILMSSF